MNSENLAIKERNLGFFERYLTLWVGICIIVGVMIGKFIPQFPEALSKFEYAQVSIPVAILIWLMIYPMMVQIDFGSIKNVGKKPKGLFITLVVNWIIKPFTMYFFAWLFLKVLFAGIIPENLGTEYVAGAVLLGAAPCTAMVFVWSYLTNGDPIYTLVQVAVNDLIILFAFAPIVMLLLKVSNVVVPIDTVILSVVLFVLIPLIFGYVTRTKLIKYKGLDWLENVFIKKLGNITIVGLLLTLIIIFSFQGNVILSNPLHIVLIAIPLIIQTFFIFFVGYLWSKKWKINRDVAAPSALIGASNFFELAVAVAISLFGLKSGAAVATVVGVLVEVPVMLVLVKIVNKTKDWFPKE